MWEERAEQLGKGPGASPCSASLFDMPESISPRLKLEREWMKECEILTHYADIDESPWLAVSMRICKSRLKGYNLTKKEQTEIPALFAGYCRLIDEGNMVGYGSTREEAIEDLVKRGVIPSMDFYQQNGMDELQAKILRESSKDDPPR